MKWEEYCKHTGATAIYPGAGSPDCLAYCKMELSGEAGEVFDHLKKILRDDGGCITDERRAALTKEIGDMCYPISELARGFNVTNLRPGTVRGAAPIAPTAEHIHDTWVGGMQQLSVDGGFMISHSLSFLLSVICDYLCSYAGVDFAEVLQVNHDKLASRRERGVLGGSGDDR